MAELIQFRNFQNIPAIIAWQIIFALATFFVITFHIRSLKSTVEFIQLKIPTKKTKKKCWNRQQEETNWKQYKTKATKRNARMKTTRNFMKIEYEMYVIMMLIKCNSYVCTLAQCVLLSRERERIMKINEWEARKRERETMSEW